MIITHHLGQFLDWSKVWKRELGAVSKFHTTAAIFTSTCINQSWTFPPPPKKDLFVLLLFSGSLTRCWNINQSLWTSGQVLDNLRQRETITPSFPSDQSWCPASKVVLKRMNYSDGLRTLSCISSLLKTFSFFFLAESETTTPTTSPDHDLSGEETSSIGLYW